MDLPPSSAVLAAHPPLKPLVERFKVLQQNPTTGPSSIAQLTEVVLLSKRIVCESAIGRLASYLRRFDNPPSADSDPNLGAASAIRSRIKALDIDSVVDSAIQDLQSKRKAWKALQAQLDDSLKARTASVDPDAMPSTPTSFRASLTRASKELERLSRQGASLSEGNHDSDGDLVAGYQSFEAAVNSTLQQLNSVLTTTSSAGSSPLSPTGTRLTWSEIHSSLGALEADLSALEKASSLSSSSSSSSSPSSSSDTVPSYKYDLLASAHKDLLDQVAAWRSAASASCDSCAKWTDKVRALRTQLYAAKKAAKPANAKSTSKNTTSATAAGSSSSSSSSSKHGKNITSFHVPQASSAPVKPPRPESTPSMFRSTYDDSATERAPASPTRGPSRLSSKASKRISSAPSKRIGNSIAARSTLADQVDAPVLGVPPGSAMLVDTALGHTGSVTSVASSSVDSSVLISGATDGTLRHWKIISAGGGRTITSVRSMTGHSGAVNVVAVSPRLGAPFFASGSSDKTVRIWHAVRGRAARVLPVNMSVGALAFSNDGRRLAVGGFRVVQVWDVETGILMRTITAHELNIYAVGYHPTKAIIATGGDDGMLHTSDASSGEAIDAVRPFGGSWINGVAWTNNGGAVIAVSQDGRGVLRDPTGGVTLGYFGAQHGPALTSVCIGPTNTVFVGDSAAQVTAWDITAPGSVSLLRTVHGHYGTVSSVAFSIASGILFSGSSDKMVKAWDTEVVLRSARVSKGAGSVAGGSPVSHRSSAPGSPAATPPLPASTRLLSMSPLTNSRSTTFITQSASLRQPETPSDAGLDNDADVAAAQDVPLPDEYQVSNEFSLPGEEADDDWNRPQSDSDSSPASSIASTNSEGDSSSDGSDTDGEDELRGANADGIADDDDGPLSSTF